MTSFTIDSDDHVATATADLKPKGADHFTSRDELAHRHLFIAYFRTMVLQSGVTGNEVCEALDFTRLIGGSEG